MTPKLSGHQAVRKAPRLSGAIPPEPGYSETIHLDESSLPTYIEPSFTDHHDPVMLFPASAHSKKCRKKKKTVSVAVSYSEIAIAVLPRRLGRLQKLAFLQERDDRFPTSGAK